VAPYLFRIIDIFFLAYRAFSSTCNRSTDRSLKALGEGNCAIFLIIEPINGQPEIEKPPSTGIETPVT
jgi:hypothetical protein